MSIAEKLTTVAENVQKVYDAAKNDEWSDFWDTFQQNGTRRSYNFAFINGGKCWDKTTFRPKYDIVIEGNASNAFYSWQGLAESVDIGAILKAQGVTIDTSKATNLNNFMAFGSSISGSLPTIDLSSAGKDTGSLFDGTKLVKIKKLIVTTATTYDKMFRNCSNLVEIEVEGTIEQNGLDLSACKSLSGLSLESVVLALSKTKTGLSVKFPSTAPETFCAYRKQDSAWNDLIAQRDNWTFGYE